MEVSAAAETEQSSSGHSGQLHSKTLREPSRRPEFRQVLDCGSPLALWPEPSSLVQLPCSRTRKQPLRFQKLTTFQDAPRIPDALGCSGLSRDNRYRLCHCSDVPFECDMNGPMAFCPSCRKDVRFIEAGQVRRCSVCGFEYQRTEPRASHAGAVGNVVMTVAHVILRVVLIIGIVVIVGIAMLFASCAFH